LDFEFSSEIKEQAVALAIKALAQEAGDVEVSQFGETLVEDLMHLLQMGNIKIGILRGTETDETRLQSLPFLRLGPDEPDFFPVPNPNGLGTKLEFEDTFFLLDPEDFLGFTE